MSISGLPKRTEEPADLTLPSHNQFSEGESTLIADKPDIDIMPPPMDESRESEGIAPVNGKDSSQQSVVKKVYYYVCNEYQRLLALEDCLAYYKKMQQQVDQIVWRGKISKQDADMLEGTQLAIHENEALKDLR